MKKRKKTWTTTELNLLGTMSDAALASKLNCSANAVFVKRNKMNIPPFGRTPNKSTPKQSKSQSPAEKAAQLIATKLNKKHKDILAARLTTLYNQNETMMGIDCGRFLSVKQINAVGIKY